MPPSENAASDVLTCTLRTGAAPLSVSPSDRGGPACVALTKSFTRDDATGLTPISTETESQVTQIATVLRNVTSNDFHSYKRGTFLRRVYRRMQVLQIDGLDDYIARLRSDRDEMQSLFQDLLIGVTQFFRDPHEFEVL